MTRPRWIVCEDGDEYIARFARFLGAELDFVPTADAAGLLDAVAVGAAGVLLDLDFRRTPAARLIDPDGRAGAADPEQLAQSQGVYLARLLRARGYTLPVFLFADFDDPERAALLERTLAPLEVVASGVGLAELAARLRRR